MGLIIFVKIQSLEVIPNMVKRSLEIKIDNKVDQINIIIYRDLKKRKRRFKFKVLKMRN